ncbi:MAG: coniferyl aldehyde dehydrogenase [Polyangiaceae bacterium]|nr:coniferyl aldehyde dehydrogenase [Polyangiaceae bacterium]
MSQAAVSEDVVREQKSDAEIAGELPKLLAKLREAHRRKGPPDEAERLRWLSRIERLMLSNKERIADAISADFGSRSRHETMIAEIFVTVSYIRYVKENLRHWMEPERRHVAFTFFPARNEVLYQPLGVVGIISPWNYPMQLAMAPLVCAMSAGNRALIKPSELTPRTSELLAELLASQFADDEVAVVTGGPEVGQAFSRLPFDHLVFTGSTAVGRHVMRAAADNLVPCTLELGGKSPALIAPDFPIDTAAERIIGGKLFNSGQTCIAPDYVLVKEEQVDELVASLKAHAARMYPTLVSNPDYTSIVHPRHKARLEKHLAEAAEKGAKLVPLNPAGESFEGSPKLEPCLVLGATDEMSVMQDEIFGPVLPILPYKDFGDALDHVNDRPRPLALYVFSHDERTVQRTLRDTTSGGVSVNDTMVHFAQDDMPFGGVGASGMGHYHGREGFEALSKKKPVFYQARVNGTALLRPPFGKTIDTAMRFLLGK